MMPEILQLGDPKLRQPTQAVKNFNDHRLQDAIDLALKQLTRAGGVGIAANQIGSSLRWCIIASHATARYPDAPYMPPMVMINPQIVDRSPVEVLDWEGCLSVPGVRGQVPRSESVTVSYQTRDGHQRTETFTGFVARIVQHECDHLEGLVFVDRVPSTGILITEAEYQQQVLGLTARLFH